MAAAARAHRRRAHRAGRRACATSARPSRTRSAPRGAGLAFPAQSSRNEIAAHYCPSPEDETVYAEGDLAKLDIGVHVDGWVVDTALTVNVGDRPGNQPLVDAARAALEAAIAAAGPGRPRAARLRRHRGHPAELGVRPMQNLCGHGVGRWIVHCPPPIPNVADDADGDRLRRARAVAIEPFATDGLGPGRRARRRPRCSGSTRPGMRERRLDAGGAGRARASCRGLPFSRRRPARASRAPRWRSAARAAAAPAPRRLRAAGGGRRRTVAQAEHTSVRRRGRRGGADALGGPRTALRRRARLALPALSFGEVVGQGLRPGHDPGDVGIARRPCGRP